MQRTHIYLPEEINREIGYIAKLQGKTKAEVTRKVLKEGLRAIQPQKSRSARALLEMAKEAEKLHVSGPKDLAYNHDYYTWGGKKKSPQKIEK